VDRGKPLQIRRGIQPEGEDSKPRFFEYESMLSISSVAFTGRDMEGSDSNMFLGITSEDSWRNYRDKVKFGHFTEIQTRYLVNVGQVLRL
jgi:hypothetical protein